MKSHAAGYVYAVLTFSIFAFQDSISRYLGASYPPVFIATIRYWVLALVAITVAARLGGGLGQCLQSRRPWLQILRGLLLTVQVILAITANATAGLIPTQSILAATPLMVALLSAPILGEQVGWRRAAAIGAGLVGVLIILQPGTAFFSGDLVIPVASAVVLSLYTVTTRLAGRDDRPITSFLYMGLVGAAALTFVGPFFWTSMPAEAWGWLAVLCVTGIFSHYFFIRAYQHLDAVKVQPISYLQLVVASTIGIVVFGEQMTAHIAIGSAIVVAAGLFTIWREFVARSTARRAAAGFGAGLPVAKRSEG